MNAIAPTPLTAGMAALMFGAVAVALVSLAMLSTPALWPLSTLPG